MSEKVFVVIGSNCSNCGGEVWIKGPFSSIEEAEAADDLLYNEKNRGCCWLTATVQLNAFYGTKIR